MKKTILTMATLMVASSSFATKIICKVGDSKTASVDKVITLEAIEQSLENGYLIEKGNTKYHMSISDIYEEKDPSKVISKDAMVLSTFVNNSTTRNMVSNGNKLMYFDDANSITISCERIK